MMVATLILVQILQIFVIANLISKLWKFGAIVNKLIKIQFKLYFYD